ncbi:MAG: DUF2807 domain-containing protein [Candidatus Saccharimonas sp.]
MNSVSVNGVNIRTDKSGLSMTGEVIVFSDGSTYNTRTGAFNNAGPGDVFVNGKRLDNSVGSSSARVESTKITKTKDFKVTQLSLELQSARVSLVGHDKLHTRVEITGPSNLVEGVSLSEFGDMLVVKDHQNGSGFSSVVIGNGNVMSSSFGGNVSIGGVQISGNSIISSSSGDAAVDIKIYVPTRASIRAVNRGVAHLDVDGIDGPLDLKISGSGDMTASAITGDVILKVSGAGNIKIEKASIRNLEAVISGTGNVNVLGTVHTAQLRVSGVGNIYLQHSDTPVTKRVTGLGNITVGNH